MDRAPGEATDRAGPRRELDVGAWLGVAVFLAAGVAARVGWARHLGAEVEPWEADAFVRTLEGPVWGGWSQVVPDATAWVFGRLAERLGVAGVAEVRLLAVGVSVVALLACLDLAVVLSRSTGLGLRSVGRALRWVVLVWAVHPTLIDGASRPTTELLLGGAACLALACAARWSARGGALRWAAFTTALALALVAGGLLVAVPVAVGLLVHLAPIPRLRTAVPVLLAVALAGGAWYWLERPAPRASERLWLPPTAPIHGLAGLVALPAPDPAELPLHPDRREVALWDAVRAAIGERGVPATGAALLDRAALEQLSTTRFDARLPSGAPIGGAVALLDLFLRGGALLFAVAVAGLVRPRTESAWPRGGVCAAIVVLAVGLVAGALRPGALAPFDLVVLGVAGAGMAGTGARGRAGVRYLAFAVGGAMLCSVALAPRLTGRAPRPWTDEGQPHAHGPELVHLLAEGGPDTAAGHLQAAQLLMNPGAPLLRLPEHALAHALAATELDPTADAVTEVLVTAWVENLDLVAAQQLAESWRAADPGSTRARVTRDWLGAQLRRLRTEENP